MKIKILVLILFSGLFSSLAHASFEVSCVSTDYRGANFKVIAKDKNFAGPSQDDFQFLVAGKIPRKDARAFQKNSEIHIRLGAFVVVSLKDVLKLDKGDRFRAETQADTVGGIIDGESYNCVVVSI